MSMIEFPVVFCIFKRTIPMTYGSLCAAQCKLFSLEKNEVDTGFYAGIIDRVT